MHLSPVKGAYPHKDQHDRTAPIYLSAEDSNDQTKIERGMVIRIKDDGTDLGAFEIATDASVFPMYLALQRYDDLQAAMAGQFSPADGKKVSFWANHKPGSWKTPREAGKYANVTAPFGGVRPAITGIHMDDGDVWETDMFDADVDWDAAKINDKLTVTNGLITLAEGDTDEGVVGFLVKRPYTRYCNDAEAVKGMMTGATRYVIQFQCGK